LFKKYIFTRTQAFIVAVAALMTLFANKTFFTKLFALALEEKNYLVLITSPFVFTLISIFALNVLLLLSYRASFKGLLMVVLFLAAGCSYFIDSFGTVIDKDMINNMVKTDTAEVLDLLTLKLVLYVVLIGVIPSSILWAFPLKEHSYRREFIQKLGVVVAMLILISGIYMSFSKSYSSFFRNHNELKMYVNPYFPIISVIKFIKMKTKANKTIVPIATDAKRVQGDTKKLVVLVLGETARAANHSLNGYEFHTNPLLQARNDIVNFSQFYSCGTATAISVPCIFSKFGREQFSDDKNYYENLLDVVQKTGVRVVWRDNNSGGDQGVAKRMRDVVKNGGKTFDAILLQDLQQTIASSHEDTFVVLHLEGSHGPTYFKRYPEAFKKFNPTCDTQDLEKCSQEQIVNTYNNTILYTDFIINETIKILEHNEPSYETALFYVSDHGESLGEKGVYLHGLPYFIAPDVQKHVPAVFYFGKSQENKRDVLKSKASASFSHDNIFHTMLGLFNIRTSEYDSKLDMLVN